MQEFIPVIFVIIIMFFFTLIDLKLAKIRYRYAFVLPIILTILGIIMFVYAYFGDSGWAALGYLIFGMIFISAGLLTALTSLVIVLVLRKDSVPSKASKKNTGLDRLSELNRRYREGSISRDEYEREKAKILS